MDATFKPGNAQEVEEAVKWAAAETQPLEIIGQGSKRPFGRPVQAAHVLDLSGVTGIESYEPAELVLTARAGTSIAVLEKLVEENGQELSFEPMDFGPLFGEEPGRGTIGGVLAANLSGPRRIKAGAARDHVLGLEAVSGRGELFKSGGRVVKNVTGYDLPRTLCGSFGTLAVTTTVTLKVNPRPETSATLVLTGLDDQEGIQVLCDAMGSSAEVSGAAHLPEWIDDNRSRTVLRLEGFKSSVDYRMKALQQRLGSYGASYQLEEAGSKELWDGIRNLAPFAGRRTPVWRISVAPTAGPQLVARLKSSIELDAFYDWSGGLVWLTCTDGDIHQARIRAAVDAVGGGHATLVRADSSVRSDSAVFHPQSAPLAALSRRLKEQFDPKGILNPGRMVSGV